MVATGLQPVPLPPYHTKCWLCPLLGTCHMGRNSCGYEVILMDLAKDYLTGEFQRLLLPYEILVNDLEVIETPTPSPGLPLLLASCGQTERQKVRERTAGEGFEGKETLKLTAPPFCGFPYDCCLYSAPLSVSPLPVLVLRFSSGNTKLSQPS